MNDERNMAPINQESLHPLHEHALQVLGAWHPSETNERIADRLMAPAIRTEEELKRRLLDITMDRTRLMEAAVLQANVNRHLLQLLSSIDDRDVARAYGG